MNSFDINHLPQDHGMILFGISMSRIGNTQSAKKCFDQMQYLAQKIKKTKGVGLTFIYADYLYFLTEKKDIRTTRKRYLEQMHQHKYGFLNLLEKDSSWIPSSFSFMTWADVLLQMRDFQMYLTKVQSVYSKDSNFRKAVKEDCGNRRLTVAQREFFLEEITVFYLLLKGVYSLPNQYLNHHEKWVLNCYPGPALESEKYLYKHDLLSLDNPKNKYQSHHYDLEKRMLIDLRCA